MLCSKKIIATFLMFNLTNPVLSNTEEKKKKEISYVEYLLYFGIPFTFVGTTLAYFKFDALKNLFKKQSSKPPDTESYTPSDSTTMDVIIRPANEIDREAQSLATNTLSVSTISHASAREIPETLIQYRLTQREKSQEKIRNSNNGFEITTEQSDPIYFYFYTELNVEHIHISKYFVELDQHMVQFLPTAFGNISCLINPDLTKQMIPNSAYKNRGFLLYKGDHFMWRRIIDASHSTICFKKLQRHIPRHFLEKETNEDQSSLSYSEKESS